MAIRANDSQTHFNRGAILNELGRLEEAIVSYDKAIALKPGHAETLADHWTTVWYMHVTRTEMLTPGAPPFTAPPPADNGTPAPTAG